jgi:hypothetical protein
MLDVDSDCVILLISCKAWHIRRKAFWLSFLCLQTASGYRKTSPILNEFVWRWVWLRCRKEDCSEIVGVGRIASVIRRGFCSWVFDEELTAVGVWRSHLVLCSVLKPFLRLVNFHVWCCTYIIFSGLQSTFLILQLDYSAANGLIGMYCGVIAVWSVSAV